MKSLVHQEASNATAFASTGFRRASRAGGRNQSANLLSTCVVGCSRAQRSKRFAQVHSNVGAIERSA
ncbi:expressed unknown protein [Ectocarpus siliculosus]|uniref:Uncharacterized protein n=1 Tax=Ectocarpus siliculosus TaxID=2880 RepID=D7FT32_ECTSI|nr:expressed unknown protein [Ectocarpus siliculosus]|eukprot:CBJ31323.1 expressed unknown protein [Ectocarpus siliculosus]